MIIIIVILIIIHCSENSASWWTDSVTQNVYPVVSIYPLLGFCDNLEMSSKSNIYINIYIIINWFVCGCVTFITESRRRRRRGSGKSLEMSHSGGVIYLFIYFWVGFSCQSVSLRWKNINAIIFVFLKKEEKKRVFFLLFWCRAERMSWLVRITSWKLSGRFDSF